MRTLTLVLLFLTLTTADLSAAVQTKAIPYKHGDIQLEGSLYWDDTVSGKRPGILVVHEWWGLDGYAKHRAEELAKLGYVAFAADMYGKGKVTEHPQEATQMASQVRANVKDWQARAQKGLDVLKAQEACDASRIGAIGYCFGGSTVLQLAYSGADVKGVVSFHGAPQTPEGTTAIKSRILICHGAADKFIPEESLQKMRAALDKAKADWMLVYYSGAEHSFTVAGADKRGIPGMKYDAHADQRSWHEMQDFFKDVFASK